MRTRKINYGLLFVTVVIALLATGCFSIPHKLVFDPDLPKEETALVMISNTIIVNEYNGVDVRKAWYPANRARIYKATLPAGESSIHFDISATFSRGNRYITVNREKIELTYNFEAGKEYTIGVYGSKNKGNIFIPKNTLILAIWGQAFSNANPGRNRESELKSWELGDF